MDATLYGMPLEAVDFIASHLTLPDLRSLRHVSKEVSAKVTGTRRFQSFCNCKAVELRVSSLSELADFLSVPGPQADLQDLTLTGVLVTTKGLTRIIRERTKPADLKDPCCIRRGVLGVGNAIPRVPATNADVEEAVAQLADFEERVQTAKDESASGQDLIALIKLFQVIKDRCKPAKLRSLTLNLIVRREPTTVLSPALGAPWRQVWEVASHMLSIFAQAWSRTAMEINRLDVFSNTDGCGIETNTLAALGDGMGDAALRGLRSFSVSISDRMLPQSASELQRDADRDEERPDIRRQRQQCEAMPSYTTVQQMFTTMQQSIARPQSSTASSQQSVEHLKAERERLFNDTNNVIGLANFLSRCPLLETLHIQSYWILSSCDTRQRILSIRKDMWTHLASNVQLSKLRRLAIHGGDIEAGTLLKLLQSSPRLSSLDMREVDLTSSDGSGWSHIFAQLTSLRAQLSHIYLDNIFGHEAGWHSYIACSTPGLNPGDNVKTGETARERLKRLDLVDYWDFRRPSAKGYSAFELSRREDVLRGIAYYANPGYIMGSVQNSMWMEYRKRQYGPLGY